MWGSRQSESCAHVVHIWCDLVQIPARRISAILIVLLFQFHNHGCDLVSIGWIFSRDRLLSDVMVLSIARHRITLQLISYHHLVCTIDPSWSLWKHSEPAVSAGESLMYAQAVGRCIGKKKVMRIFYQLLRTKRPCWCRKIRVGSSLVWDFSFNGWNLPLFHPCHQLWDIDICQFFEGFIYPLI